ncbi:MAG: hypothetical protein RL222_1360 [Bacteroidota bacterium]|jgi:PKD repeat protein
MKKLQKLFGLSLLLMTLMATSCKKEECEPSAVTASFTYTVEFTEVGPKVTFVNTSTDATSYLWNFGDETTSTEENPTHQFSGYNPRTVTMKATNGKSSATVSLLLDIS